MIRRYPKASDCISIFSTAAILVITLPSVAKAALDDSQVRLAYQKAMEIFEKRDSIDLTPTDQVVEILRPVEGKAQDSDLNYDVLILESRAYYWKGTHLSSRSEIMAAHLEGQKKADAAKKISDGYAEAYYFAGINLARWAEANGVIPSLSQRPTLEAYLNEAMSHPTRADESGDTVDGYGPYRVYGRLYFKLPAIFGGSHKKSVEYLDKAYKGAKQVALNTVYLAETLNNGSSAEKEEAKKILDELLKNDPITYNPDRVPESKDEFKLAKALRMQIE